MQALNAVARPDSHARVQAACGREAPSPPHLPPPPPLRVAGMPYHQLVDEDMRWTRRRRPPAAKGQRIGVGDWVRLAPSVSAGDEAARYGCLRLGADPAEAGEVLRIDDASDDESDAVPYHVR
eukprot:gene2162-3303_t